MHLYYRVPSIFSVRTAQYLYHLSGRAEEQQVSNEWRINQMEHCKSMGKSVGDFHRASTSPAREDSLFAVPAGLP